MLNKLNLKIKKNKWLIYGWLINFLIFRSIYGSESGIEDDKSSIVPRDCSFSPSIQTCNLCALLQLAQNIIKFLALGVAPLVVVLCFTYGAFLLFTRGGEDEKRTEAKEIMLNAAIGYAIVLLAWLIINTLLHNLAKDDISQNWNHIQC